MNSGLSFRIVYPKGDRSRLDIAQVVDYEERDWALASRKQFDNIEDAVEYIRILAKEHGLPYSTGGYTVDGDNTDNNFLD